MEKVYLWSILAACSTFALLFIAGLWNTKYPAHVVAACAVAWAFLVGIVTAIILAIIVMLGGL